MLMKTHIRLSLMLWTIALCPPTLSVHDVLPVTTSVSTKLKPLHVIRPILDFTLVKPMLCLCKCLSQLNHRFQLLLFKLSPSWLNKCLTSFWLISSMCFVRGSDICSYQRKTIATCSTDSRLLTTLPDLILHQIFSPHPWHTIISGENESCVAPFSVNIPPFSVISPTISFSLVLHTITS